MGTSSSDTLCIKPRSLKGSLRLQYIHEELKGFIDNKLIYMGLLEAPSYGSTHKEFILGEVLGVIKLTLIQNGIFSISVPPTQIKKYFTSKGHASKKLMISAAQTHGCPSQQEDICDSWAAAMLCRDVLLSPTLATRSSLEVRKFLRDKYKADIRLLLNKEM